jgi:hypothetical protein
VERQKPWVAALGLLWCLSWRNSRVMGGGGREESKSQLEGVLSFLSFLSFFLSFKWKQDYRSVSNRGYIPSPLE